jgi:intraflagellar transport protein 52
LRKKKNFFLSQKMAPVPTTNLKGSDNQAQQQNSNIIIFNQSKDEIFSLTNGYKKFQRELKNWKLTTNRDEITLEKLSQCKIFVSVGARRKFSAGEFEALKQFLYNDGSLLILLSEGGESKLDTNINFLLDEYGINVNNDTVIRTTYFKYFNPKEALIPDGVVNRALGEASGKIAESSYFDDRDHAAQSLQFVYPFGATLSVEKPAVSVLSTGSICYPLSRPICAFYVQHRTPGKICVLGSSHIFHDQYIDKEENRKLLEIILEFLSNSEDFVLNAIDAEEPDVAEYNYIPDINNLSERVKACLQDSEDIPRDFSKLFDLELFSLNMNNLPKVIRAYDELKVKHETLTLITPQFETPLPTLKPSIFAPRFKETDPPALELFDLDEHFSSESARLAQITNKCTDEDLDFYILECAEILGINRQLAQNERTPKHILSFVVSRLMEYKCFNEADVM